MKIHWNNILIALFIATAITVWFRWGDQVAAFFANIKNIGPRHSPDEQTMGLIALGFLCALFFAVFRVLMKNKNN